MAEEEEKQIEIELQPERVDFACHDCGAQCILWPRHQPMAVQHPVPTKCQSWKAIESTPNATERRDMTTEFIKRSRIPTLGGGTLFNAGISRQ